MKKILLYTIGLVLSASCFANEADRLYLLGKLDIRYVARMNDAAYTPEILNKTDIAAGTETGAFWTNAVMVGPQAMIRSLLRPAASGGDDEFQTFVADVLRITGRTILVYLVDDSTGGVTVQQAAVTRYGICTDDRNKSWPCANNMTTGAYGGVIRMGTVYFQAQSNPRDGYATVLHELVHTQDYSDGRSHMFYANGAWLHYGPDGTHYTTEAVPDRAFTFKEGIANTVSLYYRRSMAVNYFNWFARNDYLVVERTNLTASSPGATAISPDVWLYDQLIAAGATPVRQWGAYGVFRIRSVPTKFIVHNEMILALIFEAYIEHVGKAKYFNGLRAINPRMQNVSTSGLALLFEALCTAALPSGQTLASVSTSATSGGPKPYLLPLAYADYFTAYSATTKAQFKQIFENMGFMDGWVDLYWDSAKDQVRTSVPIGTTPTYTQLTSIAIALGITSSSR